MSTDEGSAAAAAATSPFEDSAYVARLWEHPALCLAFFGVQYRSKEGRRLYEEAGIQAEMDGALEEARREGSLLLNRRMASRDGPLLMQYGRSYDALDAWARRQPHARWWRWLVESRGKGIGFYHELYQAKSGEAVYEQDTAPVGPALFCGLEPVPSGEGKSRQRQQRFAEAAGHL
jgi:hypothetical protein